MGRPKKYDREDLLNRAVTVFRKQGYNGASTADLVDALGVNRKSMYAEFGSKQGLFEASLGHYAKHHLTRTLAQLEADDAAAEAIVASFTNYGRSAEESFRGLGCLLCNTAVERGALDPGSAKHVQAYLERLTKAFRAALQNAEDGGEIAAGQDLDELAAFFTMGLIGVAALVRAEAPASEVQAACRVVTRLLDVSG